MSSVLEEILSSQPCGFVTTSKGKKTSPPSEISSPLRLGVKWIKINSEGLIVCISKL